LAVCALAFLALLVGLLSWPWIAAADAALNASFGPYRTPALLAVFLWLTALGANPAIVAVCVTASAMLWVARLPGLIPALWTAFLGAEATGWSVKFLVDRTRPEFLDVATAASPSFPSGHSMSAMAVYGFLAFVLGEYRRAILRADVVALPIELSRVVGREKDVEEVVVAQLIGIEGDPDRLGVAGVAAANLFVRGIGRLATGIAALDGFDADHIQENRLGAPKASAGEDCDFFGHCSAPTL